MDSSILATCVLIWASSAFSGAWDTGSFDNDDALDWVWELSESNDLSVVEDAIQSAAVASNYLEAPTASTAIAAAEVIAALKGSPRSVLPAEVTDWVKAHPLAVGDDLVRTARKAIENIKNVESSELAQLWSESEEMAEVWHTDLGDLLQRLE